MYQSIRAWEHQSSRTPEHQSIGPPEQRSTTWPPEADRIPVSFSGHATPDQGFRAPRYNPHFKGSTMSETDQERYEELISYLKRWFFVSWKQLLKDLWRTYSFMDVRLTESTPLYVCLGTLGSTENAQEVLNLWCSNSLRLKPTAAISCCYFGWECVTLACSRNWLHQMETSSLCSNNCLCSEIEVELIAVDFSLPTDRP